MTTPRDPVAPPVRLLIVDDDPLVRAGLTLMLGGVDDITVVGEGADGSEVADLVDRHRPDVVLMDIRMPTMDGLTATEALRSRPDAPEVVVLTTFHADEQVLRAIRAGAAGFVLKDTPPAQIVDSVRRVAAGDPVLSPAVTRQLMARAAGGADSRPARAERARQRIASLLSGSARSRWPSGEAGPTRRSPGPCISAWPPSRPMCRAFSRGLASTTAFRLRCWCTTRVCSTRRATPPAT